MKCPPTNEWHVEAPWGKLRLTSWGNPHALPVFLCHGRQDSSETFQPIIDLMDHDAYYYVAMDMPGSSTSDPFPIGVKIQRFHFMAAMEVAIEHLGWEKFIFIGHSMGCELALFYNAIYPGRMTKMILFDAELALRRLQFHDFAVFQKIFFDDYYDNYEKDNFYHKTYAITHAKEALMRARNLTEEKAWLILKNNLIHITGDQYRLTWDRRLKLAAPQNYPNSYYFALFSNIPPTILISASKTLNEIPNEIMKGSLELIGMMETLKQFRHVMVEGDHDVHLSHPERLIGYVQEFLRNIESKL